MLRFLIRLTSVAIIASLPIPIQGQARTASGRVTWTARTWRESVKARLGPEQTEKISRSFRVGPNGTLEISNVSGDMVINAGGTDTITVDAVKRVRERESDARDQLARTTVTMTERSGRVEVRAQFTGRNLRTSVDFTVTAPAGTLVIAHSVSGDVKITGIAGEVRAETISGDVTATGTPRVSLAKTVSGDVTVAGVSTQEDLRASSVSGEVRIHSSKARGIDADAVSGDIRLGDVTCERASARSLSGSIDFTGPLARNGRYEFRSHSGSIRLTLAGDVGFELDAQTFSGSVRSDLPVTLRAGEAVGGRPSRRGIRGVHGDGSAQLLLNSFSGDITIGKK